MAKIPQFIDKARISLNDMTQDVKNFLIDKYNASGEMFTEASPYGQILLVLQNITQLMLYYIQYGIVESNIETAQRRQSITGLARLAGHTPTRVQAARGEINIGYSGGSDVDTTIANYVYLINYTRFQIKGEGGAGPLIYTIFLPSDVMPLLLDPQQPLTVTAFQGELNTQTRTGTGLRNQSFSFPMKSNAPADNDIFEVYVNGEKWKRYYSILDIPREAKGYVCNTGISMAIDVYFGNGHMGAMPPQGSTIELRYLVTAGPPGNLPIRNNIEIQFMDQAVDILGNNVDLNKNFRTSMNTPFAFGAPGESLDFTRIVAPRTSRNFVLANKENYITFFEKMNMFSVIDAWTTFNDDNIDDDNVVYVQLIPDINITVGSDVNYFEIDKSYFKLSDDLKNRILYRLQESGQMVMTNVVVIVDPILTRYVLNIIITKFENYADTILKNKIMEKLSVYFKNIRRNDVISKSDVIAIIENIDGVDFVDVNYISEANEAAHILDPNSPVVGLDSTGNIIVGRNEYPVIRGGFVDRNGVEYEETVSFSNPCGINILITGATKRTINTDFNMVVKDNAKS